MTAPAPTSETASNSADAVVTAHKERARQNINSGSANAVVDRMKQVVAEKREAADKRIKERLMSEPERRIHARVQASRDAYAASRDKSA